MYSRKKIRPCKRIGEALFLDMLDALRGGEGKEEAAYRMYLLLTVRIFNSMVSVSFVFGANGQT